MECSFRTRLNLLVKHPPVSRWVEEWHPTAWHRLFSVSTCLFYPAKEGKRFRKRRKPNRGERIRTSGLMVPNQEKQEGNDIQDMDLHQQLEAVAPVVAPDSEKPIMQALAGASLSLSSDDETNLARLIGAWPSLPEALKAG